MSEVGLVHNEMRFEAYRGDWLTKYALHTHALTYVRTLSVIVVCRAVPCPFWRSSLRCMM